MGKMIPTLITTENPSPADKVATTHRNKRQMSDSYSYEASSFQSTNVTDQEQAQHYVLLLQQQKQEQEREAEKQKEQPAYDELLRQNEILGENLKSRERQIENARKETEKQKEQPTYEELLLRNAILEESLKARETQLVNARKEISNLQKKIKRQAASLKREREKRSEKEIKTITKGLKRKRQAANVPLVSEEKVSSKKNEPTSCEKTKSAEPRFSTRVSNKVLKDAAKQMLLVLRKKFKDNILVMPVDQLACYIKRERGGFYTNYRNDAIRVGIIYLESKGLVKRVQRPGRGVDLVHLSEMAIQKIRDGHHSTDNNTTVDFDSVNKLYPQGPEAPSPNIPTDTSESSSTYHHPTPTEITQVTAEAPHQQKQYAISEQPAILHRTTASCEDNNQENNPPPEIPKTISDRSLVEAFAAVASGDMADLPDDEIWSEVTRLGEKVEHIARSSSGHQLAANPC